jgi:2-succinyl-5-enolpyruvyl-6-hydroxy-3-cyclohexene-1-carboxylate synthase
MKVSDKISVKKIVEQCQLHGISDIVISPGSRNAPFIISFTNNPFFNCYSIIDERSAAHFALGIAQQKKSPVAIVSTSGTATLNYAPAIAEGYMQGIPLLVITADRQSDGLEIGDGQVINQKAIYQNFCENNYTLFEDENNRQDLNLAIIKEGFYELIQNSKTVHLNVQLAEPLYGTLDVEPKELVVENNKIETFQPISKQAKSLIARWNSYDSKLIIVSQNGYENLQAGLEKLISIDKNTVVLTETTGDLVSGEFISCIDRTIELIDKENPERFVPQLIVVIGHSVISKKIKQFFRANQPKEYWSFSKIRNENLFRMDSIEKLKEEADFLALISSNGVAENEKREFKANWDFIKNKTQEGHKQFLYQSTFSDLKVFEFLTTNLPSCNLQMGNSSVVRYIQLFNQREDIQYNGNRGVSGIEGCTSTALGAHQVTNNSILISGDISFFYDSNAFWNSHVPANFKVIVINNGEGNIFKILPHPKKDQTSLPFFTTPHNTSIKKFCDLYEVKHFKAESEEELASNFAYFINENSQPSVLEIDTSRVDNDTILTNYFNFIHQFGNESS